jgi:fibro-slime domain-containing protein
MGSVLRLARLWLLGIALGFASHAGAAKVVMLFNAWPTQNYGVEICGYWNGTGHNGPGTAGDGMTLVGGEWYSFALPATYKPSNPASQRSVFFSLAGWNATYDSAGFGKGQTQIDIGATLQTSDTVWIVPTPLPNGAPKLYSSSPRRVVVMLLNPWEMDSVLPSFQSEGGAWGVLNAAPEFPKWVTATVLGYSKLSFVFRNAAATEFYGASGRGTSNAPIALDSLAGEDTVWIRPAPEPSGVPVVARTRPKAKMLMLFNPWGIKVPIQRPRATISGVGPLPLYPSTEFCGWYAYPYYEAVPKVLFSTASGARFGAEGIGGTTAINASGYGDTTWISLDSSTGKPRLGTNFPGLRGLCATSLLAATIRDFASNRKRTDPLANREFKFADTARGCWKGGWSVVKNMVDTVLGADRKPVRSAHDTGSMYPNGWTYSFRCTYDTMPGKKAEIGDSGIATNWFRTVPEKNAETCRDIPLALDTATGNYVYDNQKYFPIDDFRRLSDGTLNPFWDSIPENEYDPGGPKHNYGFCLESHGNFEYKKGQVFKFRGDDDVWFFINKKLVVDLGGIHGPADDSVPLDRMGRNITSRWVNGKETFDTTWSSDRLEEGKTYDFDFFFCERHPAGSSMKIVTSMNLRTDAGFQVRDTVRQGGKTSYDLYISLTSGQGCKARTQVVRTTGIVRIAGGAFGVPKQLSSGTWYGGVRVDSTSGTATLDSTQIAGLPAGKYVIQFVALFDSSVVREYPFTVPYSAGPRFLATPAWTGIVGSALPASVASFNVTGRDSSSVPFVIHPVAGLAFFRDSLLTDPVKPGDTLATGANTLPRRFWIKGTKAGTYTVAIGKILEDTADVYASIVFQDKGLRFVDSLGAALGTVPPIDRMLGDTVRVWFETFSGNATCASCGSKVALSLSDPAIVAWAGGKPVDTVPLVNGKGSVLVKGAGAVTGGSLRLVVVGDSSATAVWSPISFRVKGPDSAFVEDRDGDGVADRFTVHLHHKWVKGSRLSFGWPDTAARVPFSQGKLSVSPDSLVVRVDFDAGFALATQSKSSAFAGLYAWGNETAQTFATVDRIAAVALSATLRYGRNGQEDTLVLPLSESVAALAGPDVLQIKASGWAATGQSGQFLSNSKDTLFLLFASSAPSRCPAPGDSVRLPPAGDVADRFGNAPGATPLAVAVRGGQRPAREGWLQDRDGDGRIETAVVRFHAPVRGAIPAFTFDLMAGASRESRQGDAVLDPSDSSLVVVTLSKPFPVGWTALGDFSGATMDGAWPFPLADSTAPTILSASLRLTESYTDPDTLVVVGSEALRLQDQKAWLVLKQGTGAVELPSTGQRRIADTILFLMNPEDLIGVRSGDSVRFVATGPVADAFGNTPLPTAVWHRVGGGVRKPVSQLVSPIPLVRIPPSSKQIQTRPLLLQAMKGDTTSWSLWTPEGGYQAGEICPRGLCNGPELVLNAPVQLGVHVYDNLGIHVANGAWNIDSTALEMLSRDRLGRTRVRLSWDYRTMNGARVSNGVYLLRMVMMVPDPEDGTAKVVNKVWKIGLGPEEK